ncbi:MAG: hypothetical protein IKN25_08475, partial [Spirochaetales bacterium]|nr:hypothetical protein [Spirochaetales bacterium]
MMYIIPMKKSYIIIIYIFLAFSLFARQHNVTPEMRQIMQVSPEVQVLAADDFSQIDYETFFKYFAVVSGVFDQMDVLMPWFEDGSDAIADAVEPLLSKPDAAELSLDDKKKLCEAILENVHKQFLGKYNLTSTTLRDVYNGTYNCVSSSMMTAVFMMKYGIPTNAVKTKDHMFLEVKLGDKLFDVECTNPYGFDPGSRKAVTDELGKVVGVRYVPKTNKKDRRSIPCKYGLSVVYENLANYAYTDKQILNAIHLTYLGYQLRPDEEGFSYFRTMINNWMADLSKRKDFAQCVRQLDCYRSTFGDTHFDKMRREMIINEIATFKDYDNYHEFADYLTEEYSMFGEDLALFADAQFNFVYNVCTYLLQHQRFDEAWEMFEQFDGSFRTKNNATLLNNILVEEYKAFDKTNHFEVLDALLPILRTKYPHYQATLQEHETAHCINKINYYLISGQYDQAVELSRQNYDKYNKNTSFITNYRSAFVKMSIDLFNRKDYDACLKACEEALTVFPHDTTLTNNYSVFLQNIISEYVTKADYGTAEIYLGYALKRFPTNSFF